MIKEIGSLIITQIKLQRFSNLYTGRYPLCKSIFTQYNNQPLNLCGANQGHVSVMMFPAPGMDPMMQAGQVMLFITLAVLVSPGQPQQINVAQIQSWNPSPQLFNQQQQQSYFT